MSDTEQRLIDARALYSRDPDAALPIYDELIEGPISDVWAKAHLDLANHEYGHARYESALQHLQSVLAETELDPVARALAGILFCAAREMLELDVDEELLAVSIETAYVAGRLYEAASGMVQLARRMLARDDSAPARGILERAVDTFDGAGSMTGGPGALRLLAEVEMEEGRSEQALRYIDRGIARLQRFPRGGTNVRMLENKLRDLRKRIG